jgi:hypothetical protein
VETRFDLERRLAMAKKDAYADAEPPDQTGGDVDLTPHPLVEGRADIDDVPVPPDTVSLVGYIGTSKRPDYTRLYLDLSFHNYYEIPTSGITSTTAVNPDDENSPTHLQILSDTKLDVITIHVTSIEAKFLSGSISSSHFGTAAGGGAQAAAAQTLCGNITTHMPSCVAPPPCTNITTHMPSCVAQPAGGPQFGAQAAGAGQQYCTNITTYTPSCVQQPLCGNITTHMPSCVQHLCTNITTYMPSCVGQGGGPEPAGQVACTNVTTYMPSCVAQQPQCSPNCVATIVTSHAGPQLGAQAAAGQTYCGNITTHMPSCIQQPPCGNITTHFPSCIQEPGAGGPQFAAQAAGAGQPYCANITTHMPSCVGQQQPICLTVVTANPTDCGPLCGNITTHMPSCLRPGGGGDPQFCITLHTHSPSFCPPPLCITLYTHTPTYCPQQCYPAANTAATLCTQTPRTVICPTVYTATPTGCG